MILKTLASHLLKLRITHELLAVITMHPSLKIFLLLATLAHTHLLSPEFHPAPSKSVILLLQNFKTCHFKFLAFSFSKRKSEDAFAVPRAIIYDHLALSASISLETANYHGWWNKQIPFKFNHHKTRKFAKCFIQTVLFDQLGSDATIFKMTQSEHSGENPNLFLFLFEKSEIDNNASHVTFFTELLPQRTFAMGIILSIELLTKVTMICITCASKDFIMKKLTTQDIQITTSILKMWSNLHKDMNGAYVSIEVGYINPRAHCSGFAGNYQVHEYPPSIPGCVHKIFAKKYNYSYIHDPGKVQVGRVVYSVFISTGNHHAQRSQKIRRWGWLSYHVNFQSFKFIVVQRKGRYQPILITAPLDAPTWTLGVITATLLQILTMFVLDWKKYGTICFSILASILEQAVAPHFKPKLRTCIQLSVPWTIWLFALTILTQSYKGKIFSILAKEIDPEWPNSLEQLVTQPYELFTTYASFDGKYVHSLLKDSFLKYFKGVPGVDYPEEYATLKESLIFHQDGPEDLATGILIKNRFGRLPPINNDSWVASEWERWEDLPSTDFAIIDTQSEIDKFTSACKMYSNLITRNAVSKPRPFPGFMVITPWLTDRNFFRPFFRKYLAWFYESGVLTKLDEYHGMIRIAKSTQHVKVGYSRMVEELNNGTASETNDLVGDKESENEMHALSLEAVRSIFDMLVTFMFFTLCSFLSELFRSCMFKGRNAQANFKMNRSDNSKLLWVSSRT